MDAPQVTQALTRFVHQELLQGQGEDLTAETPLLELGILDSLSMVSVLGFIDETYGVKVPEDRIVPPHFHNLNAMAELILELGMEQTASATPTDELRQLVSLQQSYGLHSREVSVQGGRHHVLATEGDEPTWFLLPALGNPSTSWAPVMRTLSGTQRTIAPDLCGFGLSSDGSESPSYGDHVQATSALLDQLAGERVVLIANSAGAMIATDIARNQPERVQALVVTGFGLIADPASWWQNLQAMSKTPDAFLQAAYYSPPQLTPALLRILADVLARPAYYSFLDEAGLAAMRTTFDDLDVPTLFIAGEDDEIIGREAAEAAHARVPGSQLAWIARCGHFPPVERPQPFIWYVREFLSSL